MGRGSNSWVLCISEKTVCLCYFIGSKKNPKLHDIQTVSYDGDLAVALKHFPSRALRKVRNIVVDLPCVRCLPLSVFYFREEHFWQSALFEVRQQLGEDFPKFEIGLYRFERQVAALLLEKIQLVRLRETLARYGMHNPKIIPTAAALFYDVPLLVSIPTLWVDVYEDRVVLKFSDHNTALSGIIFVTDIIDSRRALPKAIESWIKQSSVVPKVWVIGGMDIQNFMPPNGCVVQPYQTYFRPFVAETIEASQLKWIESFLLAVFVAALPQRKTKNYRLVNAEKTPRKILNPAECWVGAFCLTAGLAFGAQYLGDWEQKVVDQEQQLAAYRDQLAQLTKQIEQKQKTLLEKQDLLKDVSTYNQQNRAWHAFFEELQSILRKTGDVFLTDLHWQSIKPETSTSTKKSDPSQPSIELAGTIFIGEHPDEEYWNAPMNQMFDGFHRIAGVEDVCEIKVHAPQKGKITFRCRLFLKPDAALLIGG